MGLVKAPPEETMPGWYRSVKEFVDDKVNNSEIRIELCGHLEHVDNLKGFTLDKTKHRMRLVEETETSVKVIIEPIT